MGQSISLLLALRTLCLGYTSLTLSPAAVTGPPMLPRGGGTVAELGIIFIMLCINKTHIERKVWIPALKIKVTLMGAGLDRQAPSLYMAMFWG